MNTESHDEPTEGSAPNGAGGPFILTVDGEIFTVSVDPEEPGTCHYDWESGPNKNYGFSSTRGVAYDGIEDPADIPPYVPQPATIDEHRASIRNFLSMIDAETGYIGD